MDKNILKFVKKWIDKTSKDVKNILIRGNKANSNLFKQFSLNISRNDENELIIETNLPPYAKYVDQGRRPGDQPPIKSIIEWCKRKGIEESAAFPIAKNIGEKGIKGIHFMAPIHKFQSLLNDLGKAEVEIVLAEIRKSKAEMEKLK